MVPAQLVLVEQAAQVVLVGPEVPEEQAAAVGMFNMTI